MSEILLSSHHEDEIFSIGTADEDDLLGPDKDEETVVNEIWTKTNGLTSCTEELEEGEIGDDQDDELTLTSFPFDSQRQTHETTTDSEPETPKSICQFVADEPKDVGTLSLTAENLQNFDSKSLNGSLIQSFEEFDLRSRASSSFANGPRDLHEERQVRIRHFLKSMQRETQRDCNSPYPKTIDRRVNRNGSVRSFSGSVSSNQSVISNLVFNFEKVNVSNRSKNNSEFSSTSGLLARARLKLASTSLKNNSTHSDISIQSGRLNETHRLLNGKNNEVAECFQSTCSDLDKLKISESDTESLNLFKRRKPNLNVSLKTNRTVSQNLKIKKNIVKPKEKAGILNNVKKGIGSTNNRLIPVINISSDEDSSEKLLPISRITNGYSATGQSQTSDPNANRTIANQNTFHTGKIKIVFSGIFTLLDKHRMYDCCEENFRYVIDFKIDMSKAEAIVICRSTESALKFISQRTSDHIRQFKIISVEPISYWSF